MDAWTRVRVTIPMGVPEIDALGVFDAHVRGDDWNGWLVPYFTEAEGKRVAAWTRALGERFPEGEVETVAWDEERRAFVMTDPRYPDEPEIVEGIRSEETGEPLYGIGAHKWTWEAAEAAIGIEH